MLRPRILLVLFSFLFFLSCEDNPEARSYFEDPQTFVVIAQGRAREETTEILRRQYEAEQAALLTAQYRAKQALKQYKTGSSFIRDRSFGQDQTCTLVYVIILDQPVHGEE